MAFIEAVGHVDPAPTHTPVKEEVFPVGGNESQLVESPVSAVEEDTYSIEWRVFNKPMRLNGLDKLEFSELLTMLLERNYSVQVHKELKEW
jgi:hypothetical protein